MWQEVQLVNDKTGSHTQSTFLLVVKVFLGPSRVIWAFLVAQTIKNLPAMQETQVQSLGPEDPLEKGMATLVFLLGESHGQRSMAGYSP